MKAYRTGPESSERATIETDDGDSVYLSSYNDESLDAVVSVLNKYGQVVAQRDALVAACEALLDLATWASGAPVFNPGGDAREGWLKVCSAIDKGHTALALVKGDQKSDDATA